MLSLADPGSAYQINAGAVAVVRGTTFLLHGPTSEGIVVLVIFMLEDGEEIRVVRFAFCDPPTEPC